MIGILLNQTRVNEMVETLPPYLTIKEVVMAVKRNIERQFKEDVGFAMKVYGVKDNYIGSIKSGFDVLVFGELIDRRPVVHARLQLNAMASENSTYSQLHNPLKYQDRFID